MKSAGDAHGLSIAMLRVLALLLAPCLAELEQVEQVARGLLRHCFWSAHRPASGRCAVGLGGGVSRVSI